MADDVNVVFNVTERGFDQVQRAVEQLRSDLQELGVDMRGVETRLNAIERAANNGSKAIQNAAKASAESARATREDAKASEAAAAATNKRVQAEASYNRERKNRDNRTAAASWDAEFRALNKMVDEQSKLTNPSVRYALYDVANAYGVLGTSMAGAATYAAVVGAQFESAFTNVERTLDPAFAAVDGNVQAIRSSLVQLSGQIPLTFQQLSEIATIGNQMGIAGEDVVDFTGTIARFSSVAGISIDETTKAFGGFLAQTGLAPQYLENLGAAIAKVGIDSNATEAQILSLMREIAAGATGAGFAADQIVGLAGTLASLQIAPERARGSLTTYFETLNKAVANGGERLEAFATIVRVSSDELRNMVAQGDGAEVFRRFLEGLNDTGNTVAITQALGELGLQQLRVSDTFRRLSGSLNIYDRDQANANNSFMQGAELMRQYAMTMDDLSSQWTIFINGINGLIDAISGGATPTLAALLANINNVIFALTEFLGSDVGKWVAGAAALVTAIVGVLGVTILFRSMLLAGTAALSAMRWAMAQMGGQALATAGTLRGFAGALFGVRNGSVAAAGGIITLRSAIRSLLAATGVGLLVTGLGFLFDGLFNSGSAAQDASLSIDEYNKAMAGMGGVTDEGAAAADGLSDSLGGAGRAAEETAKKVRTLVDYVNDLNGVFRRSSDLRFGSSAAMDEITLKWIELNEEVDKYRAQVRSLTADRALREYWLGIAEMYDDQIRAAQLREEIAKIDDDLAVANAGASTELEGNSKAAIQNRKTMRDLLGSYEDYIAALSAAGVSQEQIQRIISQLNDDFGSQAQALGFSASELGTYRNRFSDLATVVARVPKDVTVAFNPNPALQALNEFFAKAEESARIAGQNAGGAFGDGMGGGLGGIDYDDIFVEPMKEGVGSGFDWWAGFWSGDPRVHKPIEDFFIGIGTAIRDFFIVTIPDWVDGGVKWVAGIWEGVNTELGNFFAWLNNEFAIKPSYGAASGGRQAGNTFGRSIADGTRSALTQDDVVGRWQSSVNSTAYRNGSAIGTNMGDGILTGLSNTLAGKRVGATFAKGYNIGGYVDGFAGGGYTGAGHWLKPAGVVHKGEYVVPKKHVDQRTGLPDVNYVASLQRAKSAPKMGYAGGGNVGGFPGAFELGPASLGALANMLSVRLSVGRTQLAEATSSGDATLAWSGSN